MKRIILVDGKNCAYRAHFTHMNLSSHGRSTSVIFGMTSMLISMQKKLNAPMIIAWDGAGETWRHKFVKNRTKQYKANRGSHLAVARNEIHKQIPVLKDFLSGIGIKNYEIPRFEADDLIGIMSKYFAKKNYQVIIYSGDRDFLQLVSDKISVLTPQGKIEKRGSIITPEIVQKEWKISPKDFVKLKAFVGDKSDNIEQFRRGLGKVSAARLVKEGLDPSKPKFEDHSEDLQQRFLIYRDRWPLAHENYWLCRIIRDIDDDHVKDKEKIKAIFKDISVVSQRTMKEYREMLEFLVDYEMGELFSQRKVLWGMAMNFLV